MVRKFMKDIREAGRNTQGVRVIDLDHQRRRRGLRRRKRNVFACCV
jgi:hypothetical protein